MKAQVVRYHSETFDFPGMIIVGNVGQLKLITGHAFFLDSRGSSRTLPVKTTGYILFLSKLIVKVLDR